MLDKASLAKKVGISSHEYFYPTASASAHGYDLLQHAQSVGTDSITANITPSENRLDAVLPTAMVIMKDCSAILNNLLELKKEELIDHLDSLIKKLKNPNI